MEELLLLRITHLLRDKLIHINSVIIKDDAARITKVTHNTAAEEVAR